jgi:hypothetical protein
MPIPDFQTHLRASRRKMSSPTSPLKNCLIFAVLFITLTIAGCATFKKDATSTEPKPEAVSVGKKAPAPWLSWLKFSKKTPPPPSATPIQPLVLGSEDAALRASAELLEAGILVSAIRPPTVPEGSARLRITLSAAHEDGDIERLLTALARLQALQRRA